MSKAILYTDRDIARAKQRIIQSMRVSIPTEINRMTVSQWAEENRVLSEEVTPYPGPFSFDVIPYMREIVDNMSDTSNVHEVAVMKGTQVAFTVGSIENWIGYTIDVSPAPMLYVTGDAGMAETQMELRVDGLINHSGLASKIGSNNTRKTQRKTGDVKTRKEFPGGFLVAAGPKSGAKLRSMSFRKINVDELDAFPDATGKEGDPILLIRRRADAYSESYKILWGSTPLFKHNSKIEPLFEMGDQRRYFVPCKHCGHMQYLRWKQLRFDYDEDYRLAATFDSEGNVLESSVHYECEACSGEWKNEDKDWFLPRGEWRPTEAPRNPKLRSYHLPALLSPVGFRSWESAVLEWLQIKAEGTPILKLQNFVNTYLAETFEEQGVKPRIDVLLAQERDYNVGELPKGADPIFITTGADIQADRIEVEIVAWGENKESWSLDYRVFPGDTMDLDGEAWNALKSTITGEYHGMRPIFSAIDAGYATDVVYDFCESMPSGSGAVPVMGDDHLAKGRQYIKAYPVDGRKINRVNVNTDLMKQEIYRYLRMGERDGDDDERLYGACHFPVQYDRRYFEQLTAEQRVLRSVAGRQRAMWDAGERRNEALDCRVYNLAMVYAFHEYIRGRMKLEKLSWPDFWIAARKMKPRWTAK